MIAANVSTREISYVCSVDAGLKALGCQDEVYLSVTLPIMGVDSFGKGESVVLCKL